MPGFLASGGDKFNPGPETRLDHSELLCNKVLLKYNGGRESFWHRHPKGAERAPPPPTPQLVFSWMLYITATATAKSLQSCPTLCDPIPGILQVRTLEWVAISFSNALKWKVKVKSLSHVWLFATPPHQPTRLLHPWDFPGKSTGVGCHCLLQYNH